MNKSDKLSLLSRIMNARQNSVIIIEDIRMECKNLDELNSCVIESFKKDVKLRSKEQPWFDSSNNNENALIIILRLNKLFQN